MRSSLSLGLGKLWAECSGNSDGKTTVEDVLTYNGGPAGSLKFQVFYWLPLVFTLGVS